LYQKRELVAEMEASAESENIPVLLSNTQLSKARVTSNELSVSVETLIAPPLDSAWREVRRVGIGGGVD